jgi:methylmalonyl-CoA mutase
VVAGAPACEEELKSKGIKNFISVKSNVLDTLSYYQKELHLIS